MTGTPRAHRLRWSFALALAYVVIGVATSELAAIATSTQGRNAWRLAAWLISFAAFVGHILHQRLRVGDAPASTARQVAGAAALGAFGLAVAGPVRSHWAAADFARTAVLSLIVWPILTGLPALVVAYVAGMMLGRRTGGASPTIPPSAGQ